MPHRPSTHKPQRACVGDGRPSASARGYDAHWRRLREAFLAAHPLCQSAGCTQGATDVDHHISLVRGGTHDEANLRAYCHACHSAKTARHDGSFGRARKDM